MSIVYFLYLALKAWFMQMEADLERAGQLGFIDEFGQWHNVHTQKTLKEWIMCPECAREQQAIIETAPVLKLIHHCENCCFTINESDWIRIDPPRRNGKEI